jgi:hypothetical protein
MAGKDSVNSPTNPLKQRLLTTLEKRCSSKGSVKRFLEIGGAKREPAPFYRSLTKQHQYLIPARSQVNWCRMSYLSHMPIPSHVLPHTPLLVFSSDSDTDRQPDVCG